MCGEAVVIFIGEVSGFLFIAVSIRTMRDEFGRATDLEHLVRIGKIVSVFLMRGEREEFGRDAHEFYPRYVPPSVDMNPPLGRTSLFCSFHCRCNETNPQTRKRGVTYLD